MKNNETKTLKNIAVFFKKHSPDKPIYILLHPGPDGDCIGSALALALALKQLKKKVKVFIGDDDKVLNYFYDFKITKIIENSFALTENSTVVLLDSGNLKRMQQHYLKVFKNNLNIVNIDHHPSNNYKSQLSIVHPKSAATGELVLRLLQELKIKFTKDIASLLYIAIVTDTGKFSLPNTTPETFSAAYFLVQQKISPAKICEKVYETKDLSSLQFLKIALENLKVENNIVYTVLPNDLFLKVENSENETREVANLIRQIKNIKVAIVFKEKEKGVIKVSFRSKDSKYDVNKIAQKFGGGGHIQAAGCTIKNSISDTIHSILAEVKKITN